MAKLMPIRIYRSTSQGKTPTPLIGAPIKLHKRGHPIRTVGNNKNAATYKISKLQIK